MIEKTPAEIVLIRKACEITRDALILAKSLIREGISTYDIDKSIEKFIIDSGGTAPCKGYMGYPCASCISVNDMVVHGIPSKSIILKNGDIVSVDIVAAYKGYCGDATRTFCVGEVDDEKKKLDSDSSRGYDHCIGLNRFGRMAAGRRRTILVYL